MKNSIIAKAIFLGIVLLLYPIHIIAQNSLLITNFDKKEYNAGNQNWSICLSDDNSMLSGNSKGLLHFNGATWKLYNVPSNTTIRSVLADSNRIYIGTFEDFGYFEYRNKKIGNYTSLSKPFKNKLQNEEFWRIIKHNECIYFQSFGSLFTLKNKTLKRIPIDISILLLIKVGEQLFTQAIGGAIYRVNPNGLIPVRGSDIFKNTEVKSMIPLKNDTLIITSSMGIYKYNGSHFTIWNKNINNILIESQPNVAISLGNSIAIGTILDGVYILNLDGSIRYHIDSRYLQNNTILSLYPDRKGNLWVGKDAGISYVSFNSPVSVFINNEEKFACYSGTIFKSKLYLATNQGVYQYLFSSDGYFKNKQLIPGTQGQSWFAKTINNELYFGLNNGTYLYSSEKLIKICDITGSYNIEKLGSEPDLYIQSTYRNLVTYRLINEKLKVNSIVTNYFSPTKTLQVDYQNYIWLGHTVSGIFRAQISADYKWVQKIDSINAKNGLNYPSNRLYKLENRIVVPSPNGILCWDDISEKFIPYDDFNIQLQGFDKCKSIISLPGNKYWFIKDDEWGLFEIRYGQVKLIYRLIPQLYNIELIDDYENIVSLNDSLHLFCLDNGFAILNLNLIEETYSKNTQPVITDISVWKSNDNQKIIINANNKGEYTIPWAKNNISISFTSNDIIGIKHFYQYKLDNIENQWSSWDASTTVDYKRLPPGNYRFIVHTLNSKGELSPEAIIKIIVLPPIYASWPAFIAYFIIIVTATLYTRYSYRKKVKKHYEQKRKDEIERLERKREENEKMIIKLQNENLQADIENKNSQLAINTMAIIRKNQLLQNISEELETMKDELGYRIPNKYYNKISKLISQDIESEHDWELFEKLFDQAHQDFFKRLKETFPQLTQSDLRLSAYIRMNLSSKEIAPLLNITLRGVEERRYRLRKRIGLETNDNLNDFIIKF